MANKHTHDLVQLTPNPYLHFGLRLGRDEINAWLLSTGVTTAVGALLAVFGGLLPAAAHAPILAVVGPLAEKPGLLFHYVKAAFCTWREAPPGERRSRRYYVRQAVRDGWPSLRADLLYHDPSYSILLWGLIRIAGNPSVPAVALLAAVSFFTAIAWASGLDVLWVHCAYKLLHVRLRYAGFVRKSYYEARFLVDPEDDTAFSPEKALDRLREHFALPVRTSYTYRDRYLTSLSSAVYNGRKPYVRFRQRTAEDGSVSKQAVQIMYTRSREVGRHATELYRCFVIRKEKFGFDFAPDQSMPWKVEEIPDTLVARLVRRLGAEDRLKDVFFRRHVAMDPNGIFISVDMPPQYPAPDGTYWIEIKSRENLDTLHRVSDYIAWKLPVRATTQTKCDPLWNQEDKGNAS
ncbi:MAG: hypothetical protein JW741_19330 [Sedimentisphaerales bacterium]|nr:hypothetical protein [Sedimentisphaerales bacterium]